MYHKLGRPRRTAKAQMICINEPDSEPIYYKIDNKGNIIEKSSQLKNVKNVAITIEKVEPKSVSPENDFHEHLEDEQLNKEDDNEILKLTDINYFLNKKPFPSLIDFELDPLILPNQILVIG